MKRQRQYTLSYVAAHLVGAFVEVFVFDVVVVASFDVQPRKLLFRSSRPLLEGRAVFRVDDSIDQVVGCVAHLVAKSGGEALFGRQNLYRKREEKQKKEERKTKS